VGGRADEARSLTHKGWMKLSLTQPHTHTMSLYTHGFYLSRVRSLSPHTRRLSNDERDYRLGGRQRERERARARERERGREGERERERDGTCRTIRETTSSEGCPHLFKGTSSDLHTHHTHHTHPGTSGFSISFSLSFIFIQLCESFQKTVSLCQN
jgi:hypothetical protein